MRGIVPLMVMVGGVMLAGCHKPQTQTTYREDPYTPTYNTSDTSKSLDALEKTAPAAPPATASEAPAAEPAQTAAADEPLEPVAPAGRTYTVRKGDTLYALARRFYNDERRWRDIWQANRDKLPDPNRLAVGMTLVIPQ